MSAEPLPAVPAVPKLLSMLQSQTGDYTVHDIEALDVDENTRLELIEGWLYMTPPVGNQHQSLLMAALMALQASVPAPLLVRPGISVYGSGIRNWIEPDVAVVDPAAAHADKGYGIAGVHLAIEITSPSTRGQDLVQKRDHYQRHNVPYLIVDRGTQPHRWLFLGHLPEWSQVLETLAKSGEHGPAEIINSVDYRS
jgi:Uma2 family endonuclease